MSETQLVSTIVSLCNLMEGVHALRMNAGMVVVGGRGQRRMMRLGEKGTPDIMVMLPAGRVVWLECKSERGRVSATQQRWHDAAARLGHTVYVVRDAQHACGLVAEHARMTV